MMQHSESIEDYLKTLCKLGGGSRPISVSDLAERLNVSPVSVHEMIKKLAGQNLVTYQPYKGISLTPAGVEAASWVLRRHRLWERFLHDVLGLPWAQVHEEAGRLEHATSPEVAEKLAAFLDNPASCPHGYPIIAGGECQDDPTARPLSEIPAGARSVIVRVPEDDLGVLSYVDELGLRPEASLEVIEVAPFDGPITIEINGQRKAISSKLASQIIVKAA